MPSEQGQDDMLAKLEQLVPIIDGFRSAISELRREIHEACPVVENILAQVEKNLQKGDDAAKLGLNSSEPQVVYFKYIQTKMCLALARADLTRAASTALRTEGQESFARMLLALGQTMDELVSSVKDT
jgi:hypothetical protein